MEFILELRKWLIVRFFSWSCCACRSGGEEIRWSIRLFSSLQMDFIIYISWMSKYTIFLFSFLFSRSWWIWVKSCGMNSLFHACSTAILTRTSHLVVKSSICGFPSLSWKTSFGHARIGKVDSNLYLNRVSVRCFSSKKHSGDSSPSQNSEFTTEMKEERDGFFVVRKGDLVGVYKNLSDCQTQVGSSVTTVISAIYWSVVCRWLLFPGKT